MALSPEAKSFTPKQALTPNEETHLMLDVPQDLKPNHPVENALGTWHMDGGMAIFDAGLHSVENHSQRVPKVSDINTFTNEILEQELRSEKEPYRPVNRRPLSIRRIAASVTTFGF